MKVSQLFEEKEDDLFMARMLRKRLDAMGFKTTVHGVAPHIVEIALEYPPKTKVWIFYKSELNKNQWKAMWFTFGAKRSKSNSYKNLDELLDILKAAQRLEQT